MSVPPDETADASSSLCLSCGLCCFGMLYGEAALTGEEVDTAKADGHDVYWNGNAWVFRLPCPHHRGGRCIRYHAWRAEVCSRYSCRLLTRYRQKELSYAEAQRIVVEVKRLLTSLAPEGEAREDLDIWSRLGRWMESSGALASLESRRDNAPLLLKMALAKSLLKRHFFGANETSAPNAAPSP